MKTKILTIAFLLPILAFGQDQTDFVATNNAKKSLQYAQQFINQNNYDRALKQWRHTLKIKEDFAVAYREMGKVLLELEFFPEGKEAFERSFDLDPKLSRAAYFECGECCFRTDDLSQAQYYYDKYLGVSAAIQAVEVVHVGPAFAQAEVVGDFHTGLLIDIGVALAFHFE
ncbi:MAG: hypothetical protein AAF146_12345, partial [Bacteroidota bacterium]